MYAEINHEPIQTVVLVSDFRNCQSTTDMTLPLTYVGFSEVVPDSFNQDMPDVDWQLGSPCASAIIKYQQPTWGKYLLIKYVCSTPPCYRIKLSPIACFSNAVINPDNFNLAASSDQNYGTEHIIDGNFNVQCDNSNIGVTNSAGVPNSACIV